MSLNVAFISCILLVSICAQQIDVSPLSNGTIKETIYDINFYITIPASVVIIGLLFCMCYCLLCIYYSRADPQEMIPLQPVIVTNRVNPIVISSQNISHTQSEQTSSGSAAYHQNRDNDQTSKQNQSNRFWKRKNDNTDQPISQKSDVVPNKYGITLTVPTQPNKTSDTPITNKNNQNLVQSSASTPQMQIFSRESKNPNLRPDSVLNPDYKSHEKPLSRNSIESEANQDSDRFYSISSSEMSSKKSKTASLMTLRSNNGSESVASGRQMSRPATDIENRPHNDC